jgi:hypothetical protein
MGKERNLTAAAQSFGILKSQLDQLRPALNSLLKEVAA